MVFEMFPKGSKMKGFCNVSSILSVNLMHFSSYKRIKDFFTNYIIVNTLQKYFLNK